MILIPKYRDIIVPEQKILLPRSTMRGRFKFTAIRPDGRERPLTDWFDNLVLDSGLNAIGTASQLSACVVGTSNTAVSAAQTTLSGFLAGTTDIQETNYGVGGSGPYYGYKTIRYRFAQGVATGNINEVGVGPSKTSGATLWSRALTVNGGGTPTTVTVLADEVLDVTYEIRLYAPVADGAGGPFSIGGVNYNVDWRAANVTSANTWGQYIGSTASFAPTGSTHVAYNGAMGAVTGAPSGTASSLTMSNAAYSNNSLQRDGIASYGLTQGNLSGGILSTAILTTLGSYQFEFDAAIPKDDTKTLVLNYRIAWDRYP